MRALYEKKKLAFALLWIAVYVVGFSLADAASSALNVAGCVTAPVGGLLAAFLFFWVRQNRLYGFLGLCRPVSFDWRAAVPLALISTVNFWNGIAWRGPALETVLTVVSMCFVGFLEEVIFRGFLFRALEQEGSLPGAVAVSSLTFGLGHLVNLLNGAQVLPTLLQLGYAAAVGYLFTVVLLRSKSLWPGIAAHAFINATSVFAVEAGSGYKVAASVVLMAVAAGAGTLLFRDFRRKT